MFLKRLFACLALGVLVVLEVSANKDTGPLETILIYDTYLLEFQYASGNKGNMMMLPTTYPDETDDKKKKRPASFAEYAQQVYQYDIEKDKFDFESYPANTDRAIMAADLRHAYPGADWVWDASHLVRNIRKGSSYLYVMTGIARRYQAVLRRRPNLNTELADHIQQTLKNIHSVRVQTSEVVFNEPYWIEKMKTAFGADEIKIKSVDGVFGKYDKIDIAAMGDSYTKGAIRSAEDFQNVMVRLNGVISEYHTTGKGPEKLKDINGIKKIATQYYGVEESCLPTPQGFH